jgi:hypothetical protein
MQASNVKASSIFQFPRLWVLVSIGFFGLVALAASIFWAIAARQTLATLDAWMQHEAETGRIWSCEDRQLGGYPFDIEITCVNPRFKGDLFGKALSGSLARFHAASSLWRPRQITAFFQPPFTAQTDDGDVSLDLKWSALKLVLEGDPDSFENGWLQATNFVLAGMFSGIGAVTGNVQQLDAHITNLAQRGDHAYDFDLALKQGSIPAFDGLLGANHPSDLEFVGVITQADFRTPGFPIDLIEDWRLKQGQIDLKSARLIKADMKMDAQGTLGLDPEHRLQGRLDARLTGFEPLLHRFGIDPLLLDASSLLNNLLGKQPKSGTAEEKRTLRVPMTFNKGWLSIGPLRTPVALQPLY